MKPDSKRLDVPLIVVADLAAFARSADRGRCFAGWSEKLLADYLVHHLQQHTVAFIREPSGGRLEALAIGWQLNETELAPWKAAGDSARRTAHAFRWQRTNPHGDSFLFAEVICTHSRALAALAAEYQWRFPQWRSLKTFTFRRGKLVRYNVVNLLNRMEHYAL